MYDTWGLVAEKPKGSWRPFTKHTKTNCVAAVAERAQSLYAGLGGTVARVESLQALHAGAAGVAASLLELEAEQEHLAATLHNNLALVAAARKQVPVNMAAIEANFASLTARVERLQGMH